MKAFKETLATIKWKQGSGELAVADYFKELANKASIETGAEVMIVIQFPNWAEPNVVASTPNHQSRNDNKFNIPAIEAGIENLKTWIKRRLPGAE
jgi:hypothetical protein